MDEYVLSRDGSNAAATWLAVPSPAVRTVIGKLATGGR